MSGVHQYPGTEEDETDKKEPTESCIIKCCPWIRKFWPKRSNKDDSEKDRLLGNGSQSSTYNTAETNGTRPVNETTEHDGANNPIKEQRQPPKSEKGEKKPVMIEMKLLGLAKVDVIFKQFQDTFNAFYNCQTDMQSAVKKFKTAFNTSKEFRECLKELQQQLKGQRVVIKKLALNVPKTVLKGGGSVGDAATALVSIFKAYNDLEKLPVKVTKKSIDCLKEVMKLDMSEIAGEEFEGSVFDLAKIPQQITSLRENIKEIRKAPKIVKSFFEYATSIVMDVIAEFGDDKNKEEVTQKNDRVQQNLDRMDDDLKKVQSPEPPKEVKFASLGIAAIDGIFNDIAELVNPVIVLSKDLFDARKRLEQAMKAISEFRDDPSKAFDDYLEELKKRLKKGDIHIEISVHGNRIEIERVKGLEPKEMQNMESGFKSVVKSGDELMVLAPDFIKDLIKLVQDASKVPKADIKDNVRTVKELTSKVSALSENCKKAKAIPGDLKFFLCFVRNLIMDIRELLLDTTKKDEAEDPEDGDDEDGDDNDGVTE